MTESSSKSRDRSGTAPLVVHVIGEFGIGGMENGIVNLINQTPPERYRHAIIGLKSSTVMQERLTNPDVRVVALGKTGGKALGIYGQVYHLLRQWKPAIVHTRNLPTIDMVVPAALAGVKRRVHGEHGRDMVELAGGNRKYNLIRRVVSPLVHHYIAVSKDIEHWLHDAVRRSRTQDQANLQRRGYLPVSPGGIGTRGFAGGGPRPDFAPEDAVVFGTVGRMATVKDQMTLAHAFIELVKLAPEARDRMRLVMVGDGELRSPVESLLAEAGLADLAWLPGARSDIAGFPARDGRFRPALAERRHLQHDPRGHGHRPAGDRHRCRRKSRISDPGNRSARATIRSSRHGDGDEGLCRFARPVAGAWTGGPQARGRHVQPNRDDGRISFGL